MQFASTATATHADPIGDAPSITVTAAAAAAPTSSSTACEQAPSQQQSGEERCNPHASPSKNVSFLTAATDVNHSSVKDSPCGAYSSVSGGDFGWEDNSDNQSMSGYSAHSGRAGIDVPEGMHSSYYVRLVRFYQKYNPEKLSRVEEFLRAYRNEEEQLFTVLTQKYGPEPDALVDNRSDAGSCFHFNRHSQRRLMLPKTVTPEDGRTECVTPFWPGNKLVGDIDLLSLLRLLKTDNEELQRCYLGVLAQHPESSWNGMSYITRSPLPLDASQQFLGHVWSGTLANNKLLVHNGLNFQRTVLHCTEGCQKSTGAAAHERWRLTIYRSEANTFILFRVVWDPLTPAEPGDNHVLPQSAAAKRKAAEAAAAAAASSQQQAQSTPSAQTSARPPSPPPQQQQQQAHQQPSQGQQPVGEDGVGGGDESTKPFFSFSFSRKKGSSEPSAALPSSPALAAKSKPVAPVYHQPQQPMAPSSSVDAFLGHLTALEGRINARLDDFDRRLKSLEEASRLKSPPNSARASR